MYNFKYNLYWSVGVLGPTDRGSITPVYQALINKKLPIPVLFIIV